MIHHFYSLVNREAPDSYHLFRSLSGTEAGVLGAAELRQGAMASDRPARIVIATWGHAHITYPNSARVCEYHPGQRCA